MKDPTSQIETTLTTLLNGKMAYNSHDFPLIINESKIGKYKYVHLEEITLEDASDASHFDCNVTIRLRIFDGGYKQQAVTTAVNDIHNDIAQLLYYKDLSFTGFTLTVKPHLIGIETLTEEEEDKIAKIKVLTIRFGIREN